MKLPDTLLDVAIRERQSKINKNFLKEWIPFDKNFELAKSAIVRHFKKGLYRWQPDNDRASAVPFKPYSFSEIDDTLGLAYTSSSEYAALWLCNAGYLWVYNNDTYRFVGFAINEVGEVIGIARDGDEDEIFIKLN